MRFDNPQFTQRLPRVETFILTEATLITSLSTVGIAEGTYRGTALRSNSTSGICQITFAEPFARTPVAQVTPLHATTKLVSTLQTCTTTSLTFQTVGTGGTTATAATTYHVHVIGSDASEQT